MLVDVLQDVIGCQRPKILKPSVRNVCCRRVLGLSLESISFDREAEAHREFKAMGGCEKHTSCAKDACKTSTNVCAEG